jgi:hypothetical protein
LNGEPECHVVYPVQIRSDHPVTIASQAVRSSDFLPEVAANPMNGNLDAVWQDARFSPTGASKIAFSPSTDGGLTRSP